ncbi:MAG: tetratricopeptide repeat protein [Armatimonadota bacterium]
MSEDRAKVLEDARRALRAGRAAEAAARLERWLAGETEDAAAWSLLSAARSQMEDWAGAEEAARRVVALRPESARGWANWGITLRKLGRVDDAEKAQRKALSLDPGHETSRRELERLRGAAAASAGAQERCPRCGEKVFATDTQCLGCGADLLAARAELRRAAEAQARAEEAAREAARLQAAQRQVEALRAAGRSDEEIFGKLAREGWAEDELRALLQVPDEVWVLALPEGRYAFVSGVHDARGLRQEALGRVSELRAQVRSINQQIGEVRLAARAALLTARTEAERPTLAQADDLTHRETLSMLEEARAEAETLIRAWEQAIEALDAWIASNY